MQKFLVGSRAFFSGIDGFRSKDTDVLILEDNPTDYQWRKESNMRGVCTFRYKKESPAVMVDRTITAGDALLIGKFLIKDVADAIGATVQDILPLEVLVSKLDEKHKYEDLIFNAIKENNSFILTQKQIANAYTNYCESRKNS